jgi:hypothetical protein
MARKYEAKPDRYGWALEPCEEEILIAAYEEIRRFIPPEQTWRHDFEMHFFEKGDGILFTFIDQINVVRKRRGLHTVEFHEADASDYVRSFDKEQKARNRNRIRDELTNVGVDVLQRRVEHAKAQSERLPPPRMTFNEFKAGQLQPKPGPELSFKEMSNRARAFKMATLEEPPAKQTLSPDRATRMLKLASENMWREIISKLSAEDALEVAEKITEDAELRDALVKHSLEAP